MTPEELKAAVEAQRAANEKARYARRGKVVPEQPAALKPTTEELSKPRFEDYRNADGNFDVACFCGKTVRAFSPDEVRHGISLHHCTEIECILAYDEYEEQFA